MLLPRLGRSFHPEKMGWKRFDKLGVSDLSYRMTQKSLKLIRGGRPKYYLFAGVQLVVTTRQALPDVAQIMVFEEDTKMVLTVDKEMTCREEHPIRLMTEIYNSPKHSPGSLVVNGKSWYALVIDLDSDVVCRQLWIEQVYEEIFKNIKTKKVIHAGMHLLGTKYGKIPTEHAVGMLLEGVKNSELSYLKKIFLVIKKSEIKNTHKYIARYINQD